MHANKHRENQRESVASRATTTTAEFVDSRPQTLRMQELQAGINSQASPVGVRQRMADAGAQATQIHAYRKMADNSAQNRTLYQLQGELHAASAHQPLDATSQKKENKTGLPDGLKAGIESLSGYSMDSVKVHYNSNRPAQLQAHAYAQGTDIHIASGQERYLPHEAWHVVQQKQGRVKPTLQMRGEVNVNDDVGLEQEADRMGAKALESTAQSKNIDSQTLKPIQRMVAVAQLATPLSTGVLNVVGENHPETEARQAREKRYTAAHAGSDKYWDESQFRVRAFSFFKDYLEDKRAFADPFELRFNNCQKFLEENAVIIQNDGTNNRNTQAGWNNLNSEQKFISNLWIYLYNLSSSFFGSGQTDGFEVPRARRTELLGYRQQVKNIAVTWQAARVSLAAAMGRDAPAAVFDWTGGGVAVASEANARANYAKSVHDLAALNVVARTADELSEDRSAAMHIAANNRSTEQGVWKIGDAHRSDLESQPKPLKYNLVSRADFNADYNAWNP